MDEREGESVCYVIRCEITGLRKIGHSREPAKRLRDLQVGCPTRLTLEAIVVGDGAAVEASLHRLHAHRRSHGEWFALRDSDLDAMSALDGFSWVSVPSGVASRSRRRDRDVSAKMSAWVLSRVGEFRLRDAQYACHLTAAEASATLDAMVAAGAIVELSSDRSDSRVFVRPGAMANADSVVSSWLDERCVVSNGLSAPFREVRDSFYEYAGAAGEAISERRFREALDRRGHVSRHNSGGTARVRVGLAIRRDLTAAAAE